MANPAVAPEGHLLAHPRTVFQVPDAVDVSTTSAFDFDVDVTTGFMPSIPPISRLPNEFDPWEDALQAAVSEKLVAGDAPELTIDDEATSARWRARVREMPVLPTDTLLHSETLLRRAHHVLAFLLAFYAHSHPKRRPDEESAGPLRIPSGIAVPLSTVSRQIGIAPVVTYADTVLWNWRPASDDPFAPLIGAAPNLNPLSPSTSINPLAVPSLPPHSGSDLPALACLTLFTGLPSEAHFYMTSARIELASAQALEIMQRILDELFISDAIALRRIAAHMNALARVIDRMTVLLDDMRNGCDPRDFYERIRPWFRGGEAWGGFDFEGDIDPVEHERARMTAGASAGQSSIVHALDIFLGTPNTTSPFLSKMEYYMPRHHRAFLRHLRGLPAHSSLATLVRAPHTALAVKAAFNEAVLALRRFRDTHIRIATLYIVSQARREGDGPVDSVKGTGGTQLVPFLKNIRDNTARTLVSMSDTSSEP